MRLIGTLVLVLVSLITSTSTSKAGDCGSPTDLRDGWTVAALANEGLDPALICGIGPRVEALKEANAHGVVIIRHGRLIYERYFAGRDWRLTTPLGDVIFDAQTKHDIRSISKSVTSLLVGIALDRGLLTDLDAPVFSFFPEYDDLRTPENDRMTLRHLLTMSSGLAWNEINVALDSLEHLHANECRTPRGPFCISTTTRGPAGQRVQLQQRQRLFTRCARSPGSGSTSSPRKLYSIRSGLRIGSGGGFPGSTRMLPQVCDSDPAIWQRSDNSCWNAENGAAGRSSRPPGLKIPSFRA
jgi:hypothetical protein